MTTLSDELKTAIEKNLPQMVGKELQSVLIHYENLKTEIENVRNKNKDSENKLAEIKAKDRKYDDLDIREAAIAKKETELYIKEEILKVREQNSQARVDEIRNLTQTVFGSNRLNYNVGLNVPMFQPGSSYPINQQLTGCLTKTE